MVSHSYRETVVIWNPKAGAGHLAAVWPEREQQLRALLQRDSSSVVFRKTTASDFGAGLVREALDRGADRIVAVGGDGTLAQAVQGFFQPETGKMRETSAALALVPGGRGNDFLRSIVGPYLPGSDRAWRLGLEILEKGKPAPLDLIRVEFFTEDGRVVRPPQLMVNLSSFGFPGRVAERVAHAEGWIGKTAFGRGAASYILQSLDTLREYQPVPVEITLDGLKVFEGPIFWGAVLNGRFNASGFCWSDEASPRDGLLDLNLLRALSIRELLTQVPFMVNGRWGKSRWACLKQGKVVEILDRRAEGALVSPLGEIDGESQSLRTTRRFRFTVLPQALRFWQPG